MRSLRSICGVSRKDRCRNSDVSERYGLVRAQRGMFRWFGHLERMNASRLTEQIYRAKVCDGKVLRDSSLERFVIAVDARRWHCSLISSVLVSLSIAAHCCVPSMMS
ncbi:hypothetical protein EVAR_19022_1 [Eumeta japonica]|uniref:Uncharacterized protein n=1 Tax=Eumeta variegata TaxID=151549 RepID=A0A4C1V731_EUMVA|nr:hypothetical protein EVAR_19022_1 [Eumeta japonica]